jgi:uncharacterized protein (TIGR00251 family)
VVKEFVPETSCTLAVKAVPNAPRSEVVGWLGDALKIKVHAPALEGRANDALCEFLAAELGLPKRAVTLAHGDKSRQKLLRISGLTLAEVKAKLGV